MIINPEVFFPAWKSLGTYQTSVVQAWLPGSVAMVEVKAYFLLSQSADASSSVDANVNIELPCFLTIFWMAFVVVFTISSEPWILKKSESLTGYSLSTSPAWLIAHIASKARMLSHEFPSLSH